MKIICLAVLICLLFVIPAQGDTLKIGECADCDSSVVPDTQLWETSHKNYGAATATATGWFSTGELRSIYRFPLNQGDLIGATITSATFGCYVSAINGGGNTTIEIHEISAANLGWIEGTKDDVVAGAGEPDWVHFSHISPTTNWAGTPGLNTVGTDYVAAVYGSFNGTSIGARTVTLSAAAITYLNDEIGNAAEFLLFTSDAYNNNESTNIASSEVGATANRPYLELTYGESVSVATSPIIIRR